MPGIDPRGEAAVEHGDGVVPQPAEHPPQAARENARVLVVRDHLPGGVDPHAAECLPEFVDGRQRVTPVAARRVAGEVPLQVGVHGARNVRRCVHLLAPRRVVEREPAVDDAKRLVGQMSRQRLCVDERRVGHGCSTIRALP